MKWSVIDFDLNLTKYIPNIRSYPGIKYRPCEIHDQNHQLAAAQHDNKGYRHKYLYANKHNLNLSRYST